MLSPSLHTIRLFVHVLAAAVWVGGQIALAGLVPSLRKAGEGVPRVAARAFNRLAWTAYAVLLVTGIWNLVEVDIADADGDYQVTVLVKVLVVVASGASAAGHAMAQSRKALAIGGALAGVTALGALFLGVLLRVN